MERFASEEYNKLLSRKKAPYKVTGINENRLQIGQGRLKTRFPFPRQPSAPGHGAFAMTTELRKQKAPKYKNHARVPTPMKAVVVSTLLLLSTSLWDTSVSGTASGIWGDGTGTVKRTTPPIYSTKNLNSSLVRTGGDSISRERGSHDGCSLNKYNELPTTSHTS